MANAVALRERNVERIEREGAVSDAMGSIPHYYYKDNLNEHRQKLCEWLDYEYNEKLFEKFDHGNGLDCVALKSMFCDDQAEYLSRAWRLRRQPRPAHSCVTSSIDDPART